MDAERKISNEEPAHCARKTDDTLAQVIFTRMGGPCPPVRLFHVAPPGRRCVRC